MQRIIGYFDEPKPKFFWNTLAVLIGLAVGIAIVGAFAPAKADTPAAKKSAPAKKAPAQNAKPLPASEVKVAQAANPWTGLYVGAAVGAAASSTDVAGAVQLESNGVFGCPVVGADYQAGIFVVGIATDYCWQNLESSLGPASIDLRGAWSVTGRAGVAFDKLLIYAVAGVTQAHASTTLALPDKYDGWLAGAGVEALIAPQFSVGLEYRGAFYGAEPIVPGVGIEPSEHQLRVGGKWRLPSLVR